MHRLLWKVNDTMNVQTLAPNPMQQIGLAHRGFIRLYEGRLRALGFAVAQIPVLAALKHSEGLPQAELVRIARVEQSSMAQLLGRMERDGLVTRTRDTTDARRSHVKLTAAAKRKKNAVLRIRDEIDAQVLASFSPAEQKTLRKLAVRLVAQLGELK